MDEIDHAQRTSDLMLEVALTNARPKGRALHPKGSCYFCDEVLEDARKLFCDRDCGEDYEKLERKRKHQRVE